MAPAWLSLEWVSCIFTPHTDTFCQLAKCRDAPCLAQVVALLWDAQIEMTIFAADFSEEVWLSEVDWEPLKAGS